MTKRRTAGTTAFSLFAFQDIITSVTGIMVLVTLMLALELMNRVHQSPPAQTSQQADEVLASIEELKQAIETLRQRLNSSSQAAEDLPSLDANTLRDMAARLDDDSQRLQDETDQLAEERAKKQRQAAQARRKDSQDRAKEEQELADLDTRIADAEEELDEIENSNRMFFTSGVQGKDTWIIEVTARGFTVARIGVKAAPKHYSSISALDKWLASLDADSNALYLVVKPGGVASFKQVQVAISSTGLDMGFQVVADSQTVLDPNSGAGAP